MKKRKFLQNIIVLSRFKFSNNPFPGKIFNYYSIPLLFKYYINEVRVRVNVLNSQREKGLKKNI